MITKMYLTFMNDKELREFFFNNSGNCEGNNHNSFLFERGEGYFQNRSRWYKLKEERKNCQKTIIYTNDESMLGYVDLFNGRNHDIDLFLQDTESKNELKFKDFRNLKTSEKELRPVHNIRKCILAGCYGCIPLEEEDNNANS